MRPDDAIIAVDADASTPPFRQIFEQIRALIERGDLQPDDPLPTVRQLAGDLGVAPNTVARAFADLKAEGWVTGEERRPTRVSSAAPARTRQTRRRILAEAVETFVASLASRGYAPGEIDIELRRRLARVDG